MDLVTIGLIALGLVIVFVVATHKSSKQVEDFADVALAARQPQVPTLTEVAATAEVVEAKPAKAKKPAAKAPAKKPAAKKPAAKAPAKKAAPKAAKKPAAKAKK